VAGLVDIHAHVIPWIDDGPPTLEGAVELVKAAAGAGTRTLAATPHLHRGFPDVHPEEIADRLQAVRDAVTDVDIELVSGGEVSLAWAVEAKPEQLRLVSYGQRGTDLLIETPSSGVFGIEYLLYEVRAAGYRVTLAHPERSISADSDFDRLAALAGQGILLQVNAQSLLYSAGPLRKLARRLCRDGLASVIASDGHRGSEHRPITVLPEGIAELVKLVGEERANWMSSGAPAAIIAGKRLPAEPPVPAPRGLFRRR
jgi:protein-tyrosine phosphatase